MRGGSRESARGGRGGGGPMASQAGRGSSSQPPAFSNTARVDASSLSRPVRPLHSTATGTSATVGSPSTSSSAASCFSSSSPSSSVAASAQSTNSPSITFPAFVLASSNFSAADGSSVDSDVLHCIASQLCALLSLRSDVDFTANCLNNTSLHRLLSSYLHHASQLLTAPPSEYAAVAECVYFVLHRLTSAAPPASLSAAHFVTLPLLLQFASLYYPSMPDSTAAIVDRLMAALPSLTPQLSSFCAVLTHSLDSLHSGLSLPAPLSFISSSVAFLSASFGSLHALFACTPSSPSTAPFASHPSFLSTSARLYNRVCELGRDNNGEVASAISDCRRLMIGALHAVIDKSFIQSLQRESGDVRRLSDTLYQLVANCQQHSPLFLSHYSHFYRLSADIKKIAALPTVVAALGAPRVSQLQSYLPPPPSAVPLPSASLFRSRSSDSKEEESIAELRAMFDNGISDGFARACLREYNGELDGTLQHIFDNSLPARLQSVSEADRRHWQEDGDSSGGGESERQGDMLADDHDDNSSFQAYLLRTGRVLKGDSDKSAAALSRTSLSLFEADSSVKEMLKQRIIASQQLEALYDDEYDDSYSSFLSFTVDETAVDVNDRTDSRKEQQHDRVGRATEEGGGGGGSEDVRARWRREEGERERRRDEETVKRIELIAPSRRSEQERKEWERLTQTQQQPQRDTASQSQSASPAMRGMRGMRARGGQLPRGGSSSGHTGGFSAAGAAGDSGSASSGAQFVDGSLGPPSQPSYAPRGRGGRGRDSRSAAVMSAEEKEADRNRRIQQAAKDKEERKRRLNSDDDEDEGEGDVDREEDEMDLHSQSVLMRGADGAGSGGQAGYDGAEGGGGKGRGRGDSLRHTHGSGPRNHAGGGGRGGRGRGHMARGGHKAMAMKKMNSGMMR